MTEPDAHFRLDRRRLHVANQRFEIFFDRLVRPNGTAIDDFLIVKPRIVVGELKIGGIVCLPVADGKIGLMRGYRHQFDRTVWQAPSGFVDEGEDPATTARRELVEETGLVTTPDKIDPLGTLMPDAGLIEARVALYVARDCVRGAAPEEAEPGAGRLSWFTLDEAVQLACEDADIGASTVVAILRYARSLKSG